LAIVKTSIDIQVEDRYHDIEEDTWAVYLQGTALGCVGWIAAQW
jgi:hypothetical protein